MSDENGKLTDHDYDGIQEYDNDMPNWWLAVFFGTIIFAFIYFVHYQFGGAPTQLQELAAHKAIQQLNQQSQNTEKPAESDEELQALLKSPTVIEAGKALFIGKCAACHGNELQGVIGPNLVDDYWIHGKGTLSDIASVIRSGVPEKGMPAWKDMMSSEDLKAVLAYVGSHRGATVSNPKAPQGEKIVRQ